MQTSQNDRDAGTRVDIDGVDFEPLTMAQTVNRVMGELDQGRGGLLLTANVDIMFQLQRPDNADIWRKAALVVADGMPLVWASRIQRKPLPARVTGADLVWELSEEAARRGRSIFLLGAGPGVADRAAAEFINQFPGLCVVGTDSPPRGFEGDPQYMAMLVDRIRESGADLVFVALGFPKQERVALQLLQSLPDVWFMGCGGALDMAAGEVPRAHPRLQAAGAEWVHRLLQEPRRLSRRYLVDDLPYAVGLTARAVRRRARGEQ